MFERYRFTTLASAVIAGAIAATAVAGNANAATLYDQNLAAPGFYAGTGGSSAGFTVNTVGGIEFALGVINRNAPPVMSGGDGVYDVSTGYFSGSGFCDNFCAKWNIQYSVNVRAGVTGYTLADITPSISITRVSDSANFTWNPFTTPPNDSATYGSSGENPSLGYNSGAYGFQNSTNLRFGDFLALGFNPLAIDSYVVTMSATCNDVTCGGNGFALGAVQETINATPIPAALPLFAGGLGLMGLLARRRKRKAAALAVA